MLTDLQDILGNLKEIALHKKKIPGNDKKKSVYPVSVTVVGTDERGPQGSKFTVYITEIMIDTVDVKVYYIFISLDLSAL